MNHMRLLLAAALLSTALPLSAGEGKSPAKSAAELEKEKALANPYPNDFGPDALDEETLKGYPAPMREAYNLMRGLDKDGKQLTRMVDGKKVEVKNCNSCHSAARPLNSRFVELPGKDQKEREAAIAKLKTSNPEMFKNPEVWQVEWNMWNRYVKRMMAKPGCDLYKPGAAKGKESADAAKAIWEFLVYDGAQRKIGANAKNWEEHRKKLVAELKKKNPHRYEELAKDKDL